MCMLQSQAAFGLFKEGYWLIALTLVGHFVSSPRVREKRDGRDSRGDEREGQGRKRKMNENEETKEIKTFLLYDLLQGQQALPNCKPISAGRPGDARYMTPLSHPAIPSKRDKQEPLPHCVDIQTDLSLCWSHRSYCRLCHALESRMCN